MPDVHVRRRAALLGLVAEAGAEAALITRGINIRYLTGLASSNAALLLTNGTAVLATDGRYSTQAAIDASDVELLIDRQCALALARRAS